MVRIAIANLLHGPARLALSVGGVALALTLILALDAIFAGSEERITAYIDESQADVWIAQSGVRNLHTATLSRRAEYGVLKALGARAGYLYGSVVIQALLATAAAFALGLAITLGLTLAVPRLVLGLHLTIAPDSLIKVGALALIIAASSAFLPVRQIAGLDSALVFRKGGTALATSCWTSATSPSDTAQGRPRSLQFATCP